ncbi:MAG: S8 family serine peptidase [Propionibacteriaceae bacterium]|jgi:subtilisin family serine protease|nr:S8 family serine peptidase [Propionibacteriaceae bacterium]
MSVYRTSRSKIVSTVIVASGLAVGAVIGPTATAEPTALTQAADLTHSTVHQPGVGITADMGLIGSSQTWTRGRASDGDHVRLLTGDVVSLAEDGSVTAIDPAARPDGTTPTFSTQATDGDIYVIPSDVAAAVGGRLDRLLFNVTLLASYGLVNEEPLPVIVTTNPSPALSQDEVVHAADLGVDVQMPLASVFGQAGLADASTDDGPARTWGLLDAVRPASSATTGSISQESGVTKVWLDQQVKVEKPVAVAAGSQTQASPAWMELIGADRARDMGLTGEGVRVAVVDSGIDSNHPDLVGQVVAEQDFTNSGSAMDGQGHGTFVASEIAGTGAASGGLYAGVAPGAELINARVMGDDGLGSAAAIIAGLEWAAEQGADIINMSVAGDLYDDGSSVMSQAVNQVVDHYGCLVVVAAGNSGVDQSVRTPATADSALSVGATDEDGAMAWFSSRGPRRGDGAVNPQIVAPGAGGLVVDADGQPVMMPAPDEEQHMLAGMVGAKAGTDTYVAPEDLAQGTSMAAPLVAGAAALLRQFDPSLTEADLRARLLASTKPLTDDSTVFDHGAGLLDIPAALAQDLTTNPTQLNLDEQPIAETDVTQTLTYVNDGDEDETVALHAELTWTQSLGDPALDLQASSTHAQAMSLGLAGDDIQATALDDAHISLSTSSLTVPAGGEAAVEVQVDPSAYELGYVGGYVYATTADGDVIETAIGWANVPTSVALTIDATNHDGSAIDDSTSVHGATVAIVDRDTGEQVTGPFHDGHGTYSLAPGTYMVLVSGDTVTATGEVESTTLTAGPIDLTAETTITLDGTQATPVTVTTERASVGSVVANVGFDMTLPSGEQVHPRFAPVADFGTTYSEAMYIGVADAGDDPMSWMVDLRSTSSQPALELSVDGCGTQLLAADSIGAAWKPGRDAVTVVEATGSTISESGATGEAVLMTWTDPHADAIESVAQELGQWIAQAKDQGYAALILDTPMPEVVKEALDEAVAVAGSPVDLPVVVMSSASADQLRAQGTDPVIEVLARSTPEYAYGLAVNQTATQTSPEVYALVGDSTTTTTHAVSHRVTGQATASIDSFLLADANSSGHARAGTASVGFAVQAPSQYEAYLSNDAQALAMDAWRVQSSLLSSDTGQAFTTMTAVAVSSAQGDPREVSFGSQVHSNASLLNPGVTRSGDQLFVPTAYFVGGGMQEESVRNWAAAPDYAAVKLSLTDVTTGEQLMTNEADPTGRYFMTTGLPAEEHRYQVDQTTTSSSPDWAASSTVTTRWQWASETSSLGSRVEPLYQVWFELLGLDANNRGSTEQTVVMHVGRTMSSTEVPAVEEATLAMSTDGGETWSDVALTSTDTAPDGSGGAVLGEALYVGTMNASEGDTVALRASVVGGSSTFDETVTNAYSVTTAPQGFSAAVTWDQSCEIPSPSPSPSDTASPQPSETPTSNPSQTPSVPTPSKTPVAPEPSASTGPAPVKPVVPPKSVDTGGSVM